MIQPEPAISPAWGISMHEAGHLILADAFGWQPRKLTCSRKQGWVLYSVRPPVFRLWEIALAEAGPIAGKRAWFGCRWNNRFPPDYRKALRPRVTRQPKRRRPNGPGISIEPDEIEAERVAAASLPEGAAGVDAEHIRRLGRWLACRVLCYREEALHALADEAYRCGFLNEPEIAAVLERHPEGTEDALRVSLAAVRLHARWVRQCRTISRKHSTSEEIR